MLKPFFSTLLFVLSKIEEAILLSFCFVQDLASIKFKWVNLIEEKIMENKEKTQSVEIFFSMKVVHFWCI